MESWRGDRGVIGSDLTALPRGGNQVGGQDVAWKVTLGSAPACRTLKVAALPRSSAFPCETKSVR